MFKIKMLNDKVKPPTKMFTGDGGFDVFSAHPKKIFIAPGERVCIPLGFAIQLNPHSVALIQAKSGMALKDGITTIGNVIDSTYRGECHAILVNHGFDDVVIEPYQKVAQIIILLCYGSKDYQIVKELDETERGQDGFGSTGL